MRAAQDGELRARLAIMKMLVRGNEAVHRWPSIENCKSDTSQTRHFPIPIDFHPSAFILHPFERLRVSQSAFALLLNISPKTVQKWEQGENSPNGSSLKLLNIARKNPDLLYQT